MPSLPPKPNKVFFFFNARIQKYEFRPKACCLLECLYLPLLNDNIFGITKFKLFIPQTRSIGKYVDFGTNSETAADGEIFGSVIMRSLGFRQSSTLEMIKKFLNLCFLQDCFYIVGKVLRMYLEPNKKMKSQTKIL